MLVSPFLFFIPFAPLLLILCLFFSGCLLHFISLLASVSHHKTYPKRQDTSDDATYYERLRSYRVLGFASPAMATMVNGAPVPIGARNEVNRP